MGESYMDGWWDVVSLDEFFSKAFDAPYGNAMKSNRKDFIKIAAAGATLLTGHNARDYIQANKTIHQD